MVNRRDFDMWRYIAAITEKRKHVTFALELRVSRTWKGQQDTDKPSNTVGEASDNIETMSLERGGN